MFGLKDPWIILVYLLNFGAVALCVVYGIRNWNRGGDPTPVELDENRQWGQEEEKLDKEFE